MNCNEATKLKHAYFDGELDAVQSVEYERHLKDCPHCWQASQNLTTVRTALRSGEMYASAPAGLRRNVLTTLRERAEPEARAPFLLPWQWLRLLGATAVLALLAVVFATELRTPSANDLLAQEVTSSHVRSMMASHLFDVASSDQHTVKPWFDGKVDFAPPVVDLSEHGFPLAGGRLDYLENRSVAALVYYRNKHIINLFIWPAANPADSSSSGEKTMSRNGYNLIHWQQAGMRCWAVSDLNQRELQDFAQMIRMQATPQPAKP